MSRVIFCGASLLLAVFVSFADQARAEVATKEEGSHVTQAVKDNEESANPPFASVEDIELMLNSPLRAPLQYDDIPLNEIINELQETYNLPIVFDNSALDGVAISPETQVTLNLRNISLRSALNLMFRQPGLEDLTYIVDDEVLLITSDEKANERMVVQVYRVDDLVNDFSQNPGGDEKNPYSSLVQVILGCVAYDTWMANGSGEGTVKLMQPGMLVVTQTRKVQDQVQDLLEKLRSTRVAISQSASSDGGGRF